jgi:hypothetical protein
MGIDKRQRKVLRFVEDYIEELLLIIAGMKKPEVEASIEEEKRESIKVRLTLTSSEGQRTEKVEEVPRLILKGLPISETLKAEAPPKMLSPQLTLQNEISSRVKLVPLFKAVFQLYQRPIRTFDREARRLEPMVFPYISSKFYSWFRETLTPTLLPEQTGITALILKHLLRLIDVPVKLPVVSEVKASLKLPEYLPLRIPLQQPIKTSLGEEAKSLQALAQAQQLKSVGLLDLLLEEEKEKLKRLTGCAGEYLGEPVVIVLPESKFHLWYLFWLACRELYREAKGSYPESTILLGYPPTKQLAGIDLWLKTAGRISNSIVVMHESQIESNRELLERRLREAFSQGLGFLIIVSKDVDKTCELIGSLCNPYVPRIFDLHIISSEREVVERLRGILSAIFGVPLEKLLPNIDVVASGLDRSYRDFIESLMASNYIANVKRSPSERESEDHVAMKVLAVKYLHEREGVKLENILCEHDLSNGITSDVYVEGRALAVECETLFGASPSPLLKIFETVRKYAGKLVNEVWVVVRNWAALHLGDLAWAEKILQKELKQHNKTVRFFIPDIYNFSLTPLSEIIAKLLKM